MSGSGGPLQCVVFDVDDTLYLERDYVRSGFRAVGEWIRSELGIEGFSERAWRAFEQGRRGDIFDGTLAELGVPVDGGLVGRLVEVYRSHEPAIELLADARACLDRVSRRVATAIVTDGPPVSQRRKIEALRLTAAVDAVIVCSELGDGFGKPHARAFEMVEEQTGRRGPACVYVADNPAKDFEAPASLGWRTVRVRRPGGLHEGAGGGPAVDAHLSDLDGFPDRLGWELA